MKKMKNNLDEMQEQKLLSIEKHGVWFAFWALLASIIIQEIIFDADSLKYTAGEYIIFFCLAMYMLISCLKNGIWDRHLKANTKTNVITSTIAAVAMGLIYGISSYFKYDNDIRSSIITGFMMFLTVLVLCVFALNISMKAYKKRLHDLENGPEDKEDK